MFEFGGEAGLEGAELGDGEGGNVYCYMLVSISLPFSFGSDVVLRCNTYLRRGEFLRCWMRGYSEVALLRDKSRRTGDYFVFRQTA